MYADTVSSVLFVITWMCMSAYLYMICTWRCSCLPHTRQKKACIRSFSCMYKYIYIHVYMHKYYIYIYTHIHIYVYTRIHTYIHIHIHSLGQLVAQQPHGPRWGGARVPWQPHLPLYVRFLCRDKALGRLGALCQQPQGQFTRLYHMHTFVSSEAPFARKPWTTFAYIFIVYSKITQNGVHTHTQTDTHT